MNLQEMLKALQDRVDDVPDTATAVQWLNEGKDKMAKAVESRFPNLQVTDMSGTYAFDSEYHYAPVDYAAHLYKKQESSLDEANGFLSAFYETLKEFVEHYEVPARYWNRRTCQQFTVQPGQTAFTITKEGFNPTYGDLKVYINDIWQESGWNLDGRTFTMTTAPVSAGAAVTASWEEHQDFVEPPYSWWEW